MGWMGGGAVEKADGWVNAMCFNVFVCMVVCVCVFVCYKLLNLHTENTM